MDRLLALLRVRFDLVVRQVAQDQHRIGANLLDVVVEFGPLRLGSNLGRPPVPLTRLPVVARLLGEVLLDLVQHAALARVLVGHRVDDDYLVALLDGVLQRQAVT